MLGIFLDTETNGLNPKKHRLLEIAFKIVDLTSGRVIQQYETIISQPDEIWRLSDPESLKINGFTLEKSRRGILEKEAAGQIIAIFQENRIKRKEAVFICQNPSFDRVFLSQIINPDLQEELEWPYHWLDLASMHWAAEILKNRRLWNKSLSKDAIAKAYGLPPEEKPHNAMRGVNHLLLCYGATAGFPGKNIQ